MYFNIHRDTGAESTRSQRVGNQAEGARRVSPAHLPPGRCAVCRPPRHTGSHAREGRHYGELVKHPLVHRAPRLRCRSLKGQRAETVCTRYVTNVWSQQPERVLLIIILWWPWSITLESAEQPQAVSSTLTLPSFTHTGIHALPLLTWPEGSFQMDGRVFYRASITTLPHL